MLDHNTPQSSSAIELDCYELDDMTAEWFEGLIGNHSHDANGRIMSLKLSLFLLEKQELTGDMQRIIERMKTDISLLTGMVAHLREDSHPCQT